MGGYQSALAAAGAKVIDSYFAGCYQGTWGSIIEYKGKKGLVTGAFGSCTHCDAFESEFGGSYGEEIFFHEESGEYRVYQDGTRTKEEYEEQEASKERRLAEFGQRYLHVIQDKWDVENQLKNYHPDEWYDSEMKELLQWALPLL